MSNARMFPPGDGRHSTIVANGRTYSIAPGGYVDVTTTDAHVLSANGWTRAGSALCQVGPTSARPATAAGGQPLAQDQSYIDTTLNVVVTWDKSGQVWRNVLTGAVT